MNKLGKAAILLSILWVFATTIYDGLPVCFDDWFRQLSQSMNAFAAGALACYAAGILGRFGNH